MVVKIKSYNDINKDEKELVKEREEGHKRIQTRNMTKKDKEEEI